MWALSAMAHSVPVLSSDEFRRHQTCLHNVNSYKFLGSNEHVGQHAFACSVLIRTIIITSSLAWESIWKPTIDREIDAQLS